KKALHRPPRFDLAPWGGARPKLAAWLPLAPATEPWQGGRQVVCPTDRPPSPWIVAPKTISTPQPRINDKNDVRDERAEFVNPQGGGAGGTFVGLLTAPRDFARTWLGAAPPANMDGRDGRSGRAPSRGAGVPQAPLRSTPGSTQGVRIHVPIRPPARGTS